MCPHVYARGVDVRSLSHEILTRRVHNDEIVTGIGGIAPFATVGHVRILGARCRACDLGGQNQFVGACESPLPGIARQPSSISRLR
jgi:hypothetical protein